MVAEVRDRAAGILANTTMLIDEVIEAVNSLTREGTPEEEPFEEDPEEEISSDSPAED